MENELIVFNAQTPFDYGQKVAGFVLMECFCMALVIFMIHSYTPVRESLVLPGAILCIVLLAHPLVSFLGGRFPTKILINKRTHVLKAFYRNGLGKERSLLIDLDRAVVSYGLANVRTSRTRLFIYDNFFTNWIKIWEGTYFTREQLYAMNELLQTLKRRP